MTWIICRTQRMADVCMELDLWQAGLGPKPKDVIVCPTTRDMEHDDNTMPLPRR